MSLPWWWFTAQKTVCVQHTVLLIKKLFSLHSCVDVQFEGHRTDPDIAPTLRASSSNLPLIVAMATHSGSPANENVMIMVIVMVSVVILCPQGLYFHIRPTILCPWPLSPTPGRHLPGEKSTQQELEGLGRLYVQSLEQGCFWLSFFFYTHIIGLFSFQTNLGAEMHLVI